MSHIFFSKLMLFFLLLLVGWRATAFATEDTEAIPPGGNVARKLDTLQVKYRIVSFREGAGISLTWPSVRQVGMPYYYVYRCNSIDSLKTLYLTLAALLETTEGRKTKLDISGSVSSGENTVNAVSEVDSSHSFSINITSPSGGEKWKSNSWEKVSWVTVPETLKVETIELYFSSDYGLHWSSIGRLSHGNRTFIWKTPQIASPNCLIKVIDSFSPTSFAQDVSDSTFVLSDSTSNGQVKLITPNGGEVLEAAAHKEIVWQTKEDAREGPIELYLSLDNGLSWEQLAVVQADTNSYDWVIPDTLSYLCRMLLTYKSASGKWESVVSDSLFSIVASEPGGVSEQTASRTPVLRDLITGLPFFVQTTIDTSFNDSFARTKATYFYLIVWYDESADKAGISDILKVEPESTDEIFPPPQDTTPPSKVEGLEARDLTSDETGKLEVFWKKSQENDIKFYRIYRKFEDKIELRTETVSTSYIDSVQARTEPYFYSVSAVDSANNEGEKSDFVGPVLPVDDVPPRVIPDSVKPLPESQRVPFSSPIEFYITDGSSGVDSTSIWVEIDGYTYSTGIPGFSLNGDSSLYHIFVKPDPPFSPNDTVTVKISALDLSARFNSMEPFTYRFFTQKWFLTKVTSDTLISIVGGMINGPDSVSLLIAPNTLRKDQRIGIGIVEGVPSPTGYLFGLGNTYALLGESGSVVLPFVLKIPLRREHVPDWLVSTNSFRLLEFDESREEWYDTAKASFDSESNICIVAISKFGYFRLGTYLENGKPFIDEQSPPPGITGISLRPSITFHLKDAIAGVDSSTIKLKVKEKEISSSALKITGAHQDYQVFYLPEENLGSFGDTVTVQVYALDLSGKPNSIEESYFFVTVLDTVAPSISVKELSPGLAGTSYKVGADILDNDPPEKLLVTLFFRPSGEAGYDSLVMVLNTEDYEAIIPAEKVTARGLEFFITAYDGTNRTSYPSEEARERPVSLSVRTGVLQKMIPYTESDRPVFRMFSVPALLEAPTSIFVSGTVEGKNQSLRVFRINSKGGYDECSATEGIVPGKGYWLEYTQQDTALSFGSGSSISTNEAFEINLEPGWNQVGVPFDFPVSWASILKMNKDLNLGPAWGYKDGKFLQATVLKSWEGYLINNRSGVPGTLRIPPRESHLEDTSFNRPSAKESREWLVNVSATCGQYSDTENSFGVLKDALDGWDTHDIVEPPAIGSFVSFFFPHRGWKTASDNYCTDFQSIGKSSYVWDFVVQTNLDRKITLRFHDLDKIPEEYDVQLIAKNLDQVVDLRKNDTYEFRPRNITENMSIHMTTKGLSLKDEKREEAGTTLILKNSPNPFNTSTTISYYIPRSFTQGKRLKCRLSIYNMLGQEIRCLVDEVQNDGWHSVDWDGRASGGKPISGGIYFSKLVVGNKEIMKRMLFVK